MRQMRNCIQDFSRKPEPLEKPRRRHEDNIKTNVKEMG